MKIDIAIHTYQRVQKLSYCIQSLKNAYIPGIEVYLLVSSLEELGTYTRAYSAIKWIHVELVDYGSVSAAWNSFVGKSKADAVLFLCDDTTLDHNCLSNAVSCMQERFPDNNGVVGLYMDNLKNTIHKVWEVNLSEFSFCLIGMEYIKQAYGNMETFCPEYYRFFVDSELGRYAKLIGKFYWCKDATMQHWHPEAYAGVRDVTHRHTRGFYRLLDGETYDRRNKKGYLWGKNYDMVMGRV